MPCTCYGYEEPESDLHNGPLAEMLCKVMAEHEAKGEMSCFSTTQMEWWAEHKRRDSDRVRKDMEEAQDQVYREEALAKLTDYERSLLGW